MTFAGIEDAKTRADLIAFLQAVSSGQMKAEGGEGMGGGMMGGMMGGDAQPLKNLPPGQQVTAIRFCGDTYDVTTADGEVLQFWEPNLRFKTDGSADGPPAGKPADRARRHARRPRLRHLRRAGGDRHLHRVALFESQRWTAHSRTYAACAPSRFAHFIAFHSSAPLPRVRGGGWVGAVQRGRSAAATQCPGMRYLG